jgi:DNA processing protein
VTLPPHDPRLTGSPAEPPSVTRIHLTALDPRYPSRLRSLLRPPASLTLAGGTVEAARAFAIVGSRQATSDACAFARDLAGALARAGAVVVSGGALGIDTAAHRGALDAGGRTWAVAGTGCDHCFPPENAALFDEIARGPGAMLWPFAPASIARSGAFVLRNRVLVALSDGVVVAQAGLPSGALHAAGCARAQGKPLWVVPAPPWANRFEGSRLLLDQGARPLTSIDAFFQASEISSVDVPAFPGPTASVATTPAWMPEDPIQIAILQHVSAVPRHMDEIATRAQLDVPRAAVALLTLALEAVVVEDPPGFFRRR